MIGLKYDFEANDIVLDRDGTFVATVIDSQTCGLISLSQVCRLTHPEIGEQIGSRLQNRKRVNTLSVLSQAERAVEADGAKNVSINIDEEGRLLFKALYDYE